MFRSCSLIFYHPEYGYLLCEEYRKNKLCSHCIGGKCESFDASLLDTACREFMEETSLAINTQDIQPCIIRHFDITVSKKNKIRHRFYIADITKTTVDINNYRPNGITESIFYYRPNYDSLPSPPSWLLSTCIIFL